MRRTETITFTDSNLRSVTRTYKTPEALVEGLKKELRKIHIKIDITNSAEKRERLSKASCDLMLAIYNNSVPGRRVYGDPKIEIR